MNTNIRMVGVLFAMMKLATLCTAQNGTCDLSIGFGPSGGAWTTGLGPNCAIKVGRHELMGGFHWSVPKSQGFFCGYRFYFWGRQSKVEPYLDCYAARSHRDRMIILPDQGYGANAIGAFAGLGIRYTIYKGLAGYLSIGSGYSMLRGEDPGQYTLSKASGYVNLGLSYAIHLRKVPTVQDETISDSLQFRFGFGVRLRIVPFDHPTTPSGNLVSTILSLDLRATRILQPTLLVELGNKYDADGIIAGSTALRTVGLGAHFNLIEAHRWSLHTDVAYFRMLHQDIYNHESRLWFANGIGFAIHPKLSAFADIGLSYGKYGSSPDCMLGVRWGIGKLSPSPKQHLR